MLQRKNGATLSEIMQSMGWQKHTVRGFMASHCGWLRPEVYTRAVTMALRGMVCLVTGAPSVLAATFWSPFGVGALLATVGAPLAGLGVLGAVRAK
jgi:hypothetical protein